MEVEVAVAETLCSPVLEVVAGGDGAAGALAGTDGEELLEGRGAGDGGLVGAGVGADLVAGAVGGDGAEGGGA